MHMHLRAIAAVQYDVFDNKIYTTHVYCFVVVAVIRYVPIFATGLG